MHPQLTECKTKEKGELFSNGTYLSNFTASAIIASITTSAIAEPKFCTVRKIMSCILESLKVVFRPNMSHGTRESRVEITKYGILLLPPIGIQSDKILQMGDKFGLQKCIKVTPW